MTAAMTVAGVTAAFELESADRVRLRVYASEASPDRSALLVVPPVATKPTLLERALARLSQRFRVVTWEARLVLEPDQELGDPGMLSLAAHLDDARTILRHFELEDAAVLGYCSGAPVALGLAACEAFEVRKLALVHGAFFLPDSRCEVTQYERDLLALVPHIAGSYAQARVMHEKFFARRATTAHAEFADELSRPYESADSLYRFALTLAAFVASDSEAAASRVRAPSLVVCGMRDDQTHPETSRCIAARLARGELHVDAHADHYALCRASPRWMQRIEEFLLS